MTTRGTVEVRLARFRGTEEEKMSDEDQILSRTEVLGLLSQKAREGSTSAMIALERALRAREHDMQNADDEIERIIQGYEG
jgi:hypothetical protein